MFVKQGLKHALTAGLFAVFFLPFIIADSQLFPFITGKAFVFRILVEILFGFWLIAMFRDAELRPRFSWVMTAVLIFVGVVIAADIFGVSFYRSFWSNFERMDGLISLLHLFGYFLVASSVLNTRARWQAFFNVSVVSSVIMAVYAFFQLAGKVTINQGGVRVDGTFGNATYLAVFMLFNFFITLFLLASLYQGKQNVQGAQSGQDGQNKQNPNGQKGSNWLLFGWYGLAIIFQLIVLYHTATRGAILGLIGGLLLTALAVAIFEKNRPKLRRMAIGVLLCVIILIGGFFSVRNAQFVKHSPTLSRFTPFVSVEKISTEISSQGRRYVWPMAVSGFLERPILGWGQENFNHVFNKYYDPRMYNQEPWFDRAHNIVLDWLVAGGILGFLSYLGLFAALLVLVWKSRTLSITDKSILVGLTAAYFFQNLFVFDNLISYIYFFSLLAFVHSENARGKSEPRWLSRFSENTILTQKVLPVVAVIVIASLIYVLNVKPILASRALIKALNFSQQAPEQGLEHFKKIFQYDTFADGEAAEQMFSQFKKFDGPTVKAETRQAFMLLAVGKMDAQIKRFPNDARYLLFMGSLKNRIGDFQGALTYLERAKTISPQKQSISFEIGLAYLSLGNNQKALENLKAAYDSSPDFVEARILYAVGAIYDKNNALATELLAPTKINEKTVASEERIIAAYAATGQMSEAVKLVEKRVALQPENPEVRFRLSAGYLALGQRGRSVEILRDIIKLFPSYKNQAEYFIKEIQAGRNP